MTRTPYVLGFLFMRRVLRGSPCDPLDRYRVALIRKQKPAWQKGLLNGIGGKIEPGESNLDAMIREFEEETGRPTSGWEPMLNMIFPAAVVHVFKLFFHEEVELTSTTEEKVEVWTVGDVMRTTGKIPNLNWLLPMAIHEAAQTIAPTISYPEL